MLNIPVDINTMMLVSGLHDFSIGIVTVDKDPASDMISVCPIEHIQLVDGEGSKIKNTLTESVVDRNDTPVQVSVDEDFVLEAKWLSRDDPNRHTPPDIVLGDTVMLCRYVDTEEFRWYKVHTDSVLRKLEHVKYVYSNTPDEQTPLTDDNSYWITHSTREKTVHLHTSDNDGEHCTYDISIDTKLGELLIEDGNGNIIKLQSHKNDLVINILNDVFLTSGRDTVIDVGRDLILSVGRDFKTVVGRDVLTEIDGKESHKVVGNRTTEIGGDDTLSVNGNNIITVGGNDTVTVGGTLDITASAITESASSYVVNAPTITLNGMVNVTAALNVAGPTTTAGLVSTAGLTSSGGGGPATITGDLNINGSVTMTGDNTVGGNMSASSCGCPNIP